MENVPHRPDQTEIDHKDGNPLNNCLDNLRYVTHSVNNQNKRDANGMPLRGVSRSTDHWRSQPWHTQIRVGDKQVGSERFSTAREAEEQHLVWKRQYHPDTPEIWYEQYAECQASGYWE
jgi:DMSO/TMAO reductase YedYZ molybdopterin-dependent catalytic subunit